MNEAALVLLALVWAVLLVPGALRSRNASPHATVGGFERAMDVLRSESRGPTHGRQVLVPQDAGRIVERAIDTNAAPAPLPRKQEDPIIARRRAWFLRSLAVATSSLLVAVVVGGWLWLPFVVSAGFTAGYVAVLRHLKLQRDQARQVVRDLELRREVAPARADVAVGGGSSWGASSSVRLRRWDD